jgi:hypothetical protein
MVGFAGNEMWSANSGGSIDGTEVSERKFSDWDRRVSIMKNKARITNYDGFLGKLDAVVNGTELNGVTYDLDGYPKKIWQTMGGSPPVPSFSGIKLVKAGQTIKDFYVYGSKLMKGTSYIRNIEGLGSLAPTASIPSLLKALETEAKAAGATKIILNGINVVEPRLMNADAARRLGYTYEQISENSIQLIKSLP